MRYFVLFIFLLYTILCSSFAWCVDPSIDWSTGALNTIEYEHHEIHSGSAFTCSYSATVSDTGDMTAIAFNTPNSARWCHVIAVVSSSGGARFGIYEDPSIDVGEGTELTVYNLNRNMARKSGVSTIESSPKSGSATYFGEAAAAGANITKTTEILPLQLASGSGPFSGGGNSSGRAEVVLRQNTQYAFVLTASTDNDDIHNITLFWYEHTNR